jgi:hypothetical protein
MSSKRLATRQEGDDVSDVTYGIFDAFVEDLHDLNGKSGAHKIFCQVVIVSHIRGTGVFTVIGMIAVIAVFTRITVIAGTGK